MKRADVIVIGAGLSGLTIAHLLRDSGLKVMVLEARNRIGGRIETLEIDDGTVEMGATWIHPHHQYMLELVQELGITLEEQYTGERVLYHLDTGVQFAPYPDQSLPSYIVKGGTSTIIRKLAENKEIYLETVVEKVISEDKGISLETTKGNFSGKYVISTLPPYLLFKTLEFDPELPSDLKDVLQNAHTWMGESIKASVTVPGKSWQKLMVGTALSNIGPFTELHDHRASEERAILKGFLDPQFSRFSEPQRKQAAINQIGAIIPGLKAEEIRYYEKVWSEEKYTFLPYLHYLAPHQNNGHPALQVSYLDGKFLLAGAETSVSSPGYMDGAVESAKRVATQLKSNFTEASQKLGDRL